MSIYADDKGFSFIELLIAMAISLVVMGAIYQLFSSANEIFVTQERRVDMRQDIRSILYLMTKEIRMAGLDPNRNATCAGITFANATSLYICYDQDGDGICTDDADHVYGYNSTKEMITVLVNGGTIPQPFAEDISSVLFTYILSDGSNSTNPSNLDMIRMINIQICREFDGSYSQKYDRLFCYNATVRCRNMGLK